MWRSTGILLVSLLCTARWTALSREPARPESVQESERGESATDALALASGVQESFDALERAYIYDTLTRRTAFLLWGDASGDFSWKGTEGRIRADRILVLATVESQSREGEGGARDILSAPGAGEEPPRREEAEGSRERLRLTSPSFYAEGNVHLEAAGIVFDADAFYYDHRRQRGVAVRVRGRGDLDALDRLQGLFRQSGLTFLGEEGSADGVRPTMGSAGAPRESRRYRVLERRSDAEQGRGVERALPPGSTRRRSLIQMAFRAEILRLTDLDHYEGENLVISTCEYGSPHFGLRFERLTVSRRPGAGQGTAAPKGEASPAGASEVDIGPEDSGTAQTPEALSKGEHFSIDPEGGWLEFGGLSLVPFPVGYWNTRWIEYNPIRRVGYSSSSKFGQRADVDWNLNWILKHLPGADLEIVDAFLDDSRIDVQTDYLSRRGFGHGIDGDYGTSTRRWAPWELEPSGAEYRGRGLFYRIDDHGPDRTGPEDAPDFDDVRHWANVVHRQRIPRVGVLDVEYSDPSDDNFLREYFPQTKTEKEQESLLYFRRTFRDNLAFTGLYKFRTSDFETTRERLPEAKLLVLEQPVGGTGLYTSLHVSASHLRLRPDDALDERTRRYGRFDVLNEWSYPFGLREYLQVRPFFAARWTAYEEGQNPSGRSIDRESLLGGVSASQEWSRIIRLARRGLLERWFDISALKHSVIPRLTYLNVFENTEPPRRFLPFDEVDAVDRRELLDLSLRNVVWARSRRLARRDDPRRSSPRAATADRPGREALRTVSATTRAILDLETSLQWYPRPGRDNSGNQWSFLDVDATFYPFQYLGLRSRNFFDPTDHMDFRLTDNSVSVEPVPGVFRVTAGERFRRGVSEFLYGTVGLHLSRRYFLEAFYGQDLTGQDRTDVELRLVRFFHRFAVEGAFSFDAGERDNVSFSVNVYPVELFTDFTDRRRFDSQAGIVEDGGRR